MLGRNSFNGIVTLFSGHILSFLFVSHTYDEAFPCSLSMAVINFTVIQYCFLLKIVKNSFEFINDCLQEILRDEVWSIENVSTRNLTLPTDIQTLNDLFRSSCDLSQDISDFYSFPMIASLLNIFSNQVIRWYIVVKESLTWDELPDYEGYGEMIYDNFGLFSFAILSITVTNTCSEVRILLSSA